MRNETAPVRLRDYRVPDFLIDKTELDLQLDPVATRVRTRLAMRRNPAADARAPLILVGDELTLVSVAIDGRPLPAGSYEATSERLSIAAVPEGAFSLELVTEIAPARNTKLMGLYRSGGNYCTQCEAEGFRRITYYLDRPDVLSVFTTRIEATKAENPILLANGNLIESGDVGTGRHYAVWHDPFPKPAYLFAMVAGDLGVVTDTFTTMSGRNVDLRIYCEHGKEARCAYAMDALKRSMRWDETAFGREYDLDIFMIVAVSDFNMGAMENKGLNIFNDKYVLADPDTATDVDFAHVEGVIAHEYFHNWTGDRITCRDWFQLCLKEGLTVYRDQEFSSDMRSRAVKRIADVRTLQARQFPEDSGPLAHPVRPEIYHEINNFYTPTVYEKGAEVVRMLKIILGAEGFRAGMDLYFERHDGQAVTIEDFLAAFADATGADLGQFKLWYSQAGTPEVTAKGDIRRPAEDVQAHPHPELPADAGPERQAAHAHSGALRPGRGKWRRPRLPVGQGRGNRRRCHPAHRTEPDHRLQRRLEPAGALAASRLFRAGASLDRPLLRRPALSPSRRRRPVQSLAGRPDARQPQPDRRDGGDRQRAGSRIRRLLHRRPRRGCRGRRPGARAPRPDSSRFPAKPTSRARSAATSIPMRSSPPATGCASRSPAASGASLPTLPTASLSAAPILPTRALPGGALSPTPRSTSWSAVVTARRSSASSSGSEVRTT